MNEENKNSFEIIDFRLTAIENEIKELKELLISVPILVNKLDGLQNETKEELEKLNNKIDVANEHIENKMHTEISNEISRLETKIQTSEDTLRMETKNRIEQAERRINVLETNMDLIHKTVNEIRHADTKKSAAKWDKILDIGFKAIVTAAVTYFLYKIGIKPA